MSDYPMLISNKLHSFRNFYMRTYNILRICYNFSESYFRLLFRLVGIPIIFLIAFISQLFEVPLLMDFTLVQYHSFNKK